MRNWALLAIAVMLIGANGFFVVVEFALLAARRGRIEQWAEEGRPGASSALRAMKSLNLQLAACQLGITVMSLLLGLLIEPVIGEALKGLFESTPLPQGASAVVGVVLGLTFVSFVHLVLGEMVPKSVALAAPELSLIRVAGLHRGVTILTRPLIVGLNTLAVWGTRLLRVEPADELGQAHTPEELDAMLQESVVGGELEPGEHGLLAGALGFLRVRVGDVMAPAAELVTVPSTATLAEAEQLIHDSGHSRVLVTAGDSVVGFLHAKDLLKVSTSTSSDLLPDGIVRVGLWVSPREPLSEVLLRMRRARRHVAVVAEGGDHGQILGLVSMEDLLEAIVGDIRDESDHDDTGPRGPDEGGDS